MIYAQGILTMKTEVCKAERPWAQGYNTLDFLSFLPIQMNQKEVWRLARSISAVLLNLM